MNRRILDLALSAVACLVLVLALSGCSSISEYRRVYLGSPQVSPTDPAKVAILASEPTQPKDRLGEVRLTIDGEPSREEIDNRLKKGAAQLGADAVYVVYDRVHSFPMVYSGWYGPMGVSEVLRREIIGVAVKYK
jgi:hypothetical protein